MKIGTDGVLLGAWVNIGDGVNSILDIGTGTGLIALQMAQRSRAMLIDAMEIEENAFEQAVENFENSPWGDRLYCYHASVQEFSKEIDEKYDLIVSNPPYFRDTFKDLPQDRALARHTLELAYEDLLLSASKLLAPSGSCAFIIPFREETDFLSKASHLSLYPSRITRVRGHENSVVKRSLVQLSNTSSTPGIDELVIEKQRHVYTPQYRQLVQDFYLNIP